MKQNRDLVSVLNSIKSAIKYGVAVIVSIFFLLARFGIDKVKAVAPQSFNMALPPADPVHEPPANTTVEYVQQPPVLLLSAVLFLLFPVNLYSIIKKYRTAQFTGGELTRAVLVQCYWWSIIFWVVAWFLPSSGFDLTVLATIFLSLVFISGIELVLSSAGDHRFLRTGIVLSVLSVPVLLFWFYAFSLYSAVVNNPYQYDGGMIFIISMLYYGLSVLIGLAMAAALPFMILIYVARLASGKLELSPTQKKIVFLFLSLVFSYIVFIVFRLDAAFFFLFIYFIVFAFLIFKKDYFK